MKDNIRSLTASLPTLRIFRAYPTSFVVALVVLTTILVLRHAATSKPTLAQSSCFFETSSTNGGSQLWGGGSTYAPKISQRFIPTSNATLNIAFHRIARLGGPTDNVTLNIYAGGTNPENGVLVAGPISVAGNTIPDNNSTSISYTAFVLATPLTLTAGTTYWFTFNRDLEGSFTDAYISTYWTYIYFSSVNDGWIYVPFDGWKQVTTWPQGFLIGWSLLLCTTPAPTPTPTPTPTPCTISCSATVPTTGLAGISVSFNASAILSNCSGSAAYDWNFGDGTPHSSLQNPTHTYTIAGAYTWSVTVNVGVGISCTRVGIISVDLPFSHPVSPVRISQTYGNRRNTDECNDNNVDYFHTGIDYGNAGSLDILATADGKVIKIPDEGGKCRNHGLGRTVLIEHKILNKTIYSLYGHLSEILVEEGQAVTRSQTVIGKMGKDCTSSIHLHFEIKSAAVLENPIGSPCGKSTCKKGGGYKCYGYTKDGSPDNYGYFNPLTFITP